VRSEADSYTSGDGKGLDALALVLAIADSIQVNVFPPGNGSTPEVGKGARIPVGADTISLNLTVIAENNKRVAVELFVGGALAFFGVDQDVDVVTDQNTKVAIRAVPFQMGTISVNPARIWQDETFTMSWPPVAGAASYHVQESPFPDFSVIAWQTFAVDTFISGPLSAGNYYFRVAARNVYTRSEWSIMQIHVAGAPQVTGTAPSEVLRGQVANFDVFGIDLDHPSVQVSVFGQPCAISNVTPTSLQASVLVPARAFSDFVTVTNQFGSDDADDLMKVATIGYVMGPAATGDIVTANFYKSMIEAYGGIQNSAVYIVPYDFIPSFDVSVFDVIIVGWDTGTSASDWGGGGVWGATRADAIRTAGASVIGMGVGGAAYFELAGLNIGLSNCSQELSTSIWVVDRTADIYNMPNVVTAPPNGTISIYSGSFGVLRLAVKTPPNGVNVYAAENAIEKNYPFVDEPVSVSGPGTLTNFLWGFTGSPMDLTPNGSDIFENVVKFMFDDGTKDVFQQGP
jgi:hypothetical protein